MSTPSTITCQINGEAREIPAGLSVAGLLAHLQVQATQVAVEVNAQVVRRARHAEHLVAAGDQIEIVTFVGGG